VQSPNFNDRKQDMDMVVIHYTNMKNAHVALERLCDVESAGSAHYLIDKTGQVFQLVAEDKRAWHAGVAWWGGETDINSRSIGIELDNTGCEPFSEPQMAALETLLYDIKHRYSLKAKNIVGHSDVSMGRKVDPGEAFDWIRLERQGLAFDPSNGFEDLGYCQDNPEKLKAALALRFGNRLRPYQE